jgi:hypothetical protein
MVVYFNTKTGCQIRADRFNQITLDHLNGLNAGWDYTDIVNFNRWNKFSGRFHSYFHLEEPLEKDENGNKN